MPIAIPQLQPKPDQLCRLLKAWPTDTYNVYGNRIDCSALHGHRLEQARNILALPSEQIATVHEHGELVALAGWCPLPWDSSHFGFSAARIDALVAAGDYPQCRARKHQLLGHLLEQCSTRIVRHLSIRVQAADLTSIHALEHHGFELIDGIQTFTLPLDGFMAESVSVPGVQIGSFEPWQLEGVLDIARTAYRFDRFHSDPALAEGAADRLHEDWLRNSCAGKAADLVMVASQQRQVLGFVTVRFDPANLFRNGGRLATIVLVATAESGRGRGIAKATTMATLHWLLQREVAAVQVGTQLSNIGAGRLYESCGFRLSASTLTFRKLIPEEPRLPYAHQNFAHRR